jgi:hypothetical protein
MKEFSDRLHLLFNTSMCGLDSIQSLTMTVDKMERSDTARRITKGRIIGTLLYSLQPMT